MNVHQLTFALALSVGIALPAAFAQPLYVPSGTSGVTSSNNPSSGNVGIGTASPATALEVRRDHSSEAVLRLSNAQITRSPVALEFYGDYNGTGTLYQLGRVLAVADGVGWVDSRVTLQSVDTSGTLVNTLTAKNGNVGIGTTNPDEKLSVEGNISLGGGYLALRNAVGGTAYAVFQTQSSDFNLRVFGSNGWLDALRIDGDSGNVGIGTTSPSHKLAVNGTIRAKEVIVDTGWADYVFAADYRLAPLSEVEAHIQAKKHLPGIPSAAEVAEHGVSMGDMQARMMAKIEELTLHVIRQEKEIQALRAQVAQHSTP